jgi:hypothetical protein
MQSVTFTMLAIVLFEIQQRGLSGCLTGFNGNQTTQIFFSKGKIWHSSAKPKQAEGEYALYQLLGWKSGVLSWSNDVTAPVVSVTPHQANDFFNTLIIMQERGTLLSQGGQTVDPAFFGLKSQAKCADLDTTFWSNILAANYCPYRDVVATNDNYRQLLRAFETSTRTGIIKVEYNGFEEFHLVERGVLLGAFHFDEVRNCFKNIVKTDFSLFNLAGSGLYVFLVPPKAQVPAPVAVVPDPQEVEKLDINNPYDF